MAWPSKVGTKTRLHRIFLIFALRAHESGVTQVCICDRFAPKILRPDSTLPALAEGRLDNDPQAPACAARR